jgi:replicative DNA helicase
MSLLAFAPPHNLEAERGVIGALLLDPQIIDDVVPMLSIDDFYSDANRRIYKHLVEMRNNGSGIDLTLLLDRLRHANEFEAVGGPSYIAELIGGSYITFHVVYYANIVRENGTLRRLIHASSSITQEAFAPDTTAKDLLNKAAQQIFELCESQTLNQITDMYAAMMDATKYVENRLKGVHDGISTGFVDLDHILDGFHTNELIILAARPGIGKTALGMNIAEHVAVDQKKTVLVVSLEMAKRELSLRLICSRSKINNNKIRKNILSSADFERFHASVNEMSQAPMYFDDTPFRTVSEIAAVARRLKRQHNLQLLVVDYLGLVTPDNITDPRQEQVAKIARRLKGLARELHIPVLCLAQLNRQVEMGRDIVPKLSHLRESGAIEQDADVVLFIHRERFPDQTEGVPREVSKIIVAKQRAGSTGEVELVWQPEYTRFVSKATQQQEDAAVYADDFNAFAVPEDF